ncbi:MAG: hypothetical protein HQL22_09560 [Candidatus Omnitrophica bacterium]|nr:hypothetical protein [Candidatus Omnitrophota bacterium]
MIKKMKVDKSFVPCSVADGDEMYANGIFVFNITKMIECLGADPDGIALESVAVSDLWESSSINEPHVDSVDVSKPVIMAEIAPGKYNLIDGNHRVAKACKMGIKSVQAYRFNVQQHMRFLTDSKAYATYVEYWNSKLKDFKSDGS